MEFETSTFHTFLIALRDELLERDGLQGVQVSTAPLGDETDDRESIWFGDLDVTQTWGMIGNLRRDESFTVRGTVWVQRPGKGEADADEVRGRARELLAEIEACMRAKVTTDRRFKGAEFGSARVEQGFNEAGRYCWIDFEVTVNETLARS